MAAAACGRGRTVAHDMAAAAPAGAEEAERAELVSFSCSECYVYAIPPGLATASGHRAESWGLDKWIQIVNVRVVEKGDLGLVRLEDSASGELYAQCPLPLDGPLSAAVEARFNPLNCLS